MAATSPVISVADLRKHYGEVNAVDDASFEVGRGEVFGLLGPNGAGKTTTIEVLEGLNGPDSGAISVLGRAAAGDGRWRRIRAARSRRAHPGRLAERLVPDQRALLPLAVTGRPASAQR